MHRAQQLDLVVAVHQRLALRAQSVDARKVVAQPHQRAMRSIERVQPRTRGLHLCCHRRAQLHLVGLRRQGQKRR